MNLKDHLEYQMLHAQLRYHKYLYYRLAQNEISDFQYDILERRFDKLAEAYNLAGSWVDSYDRPYEE